ncbi:MULTISPECIES: hypothetical protein [Nitrosopumilus]|uniref:Uncharacterized protein n=1 Tax=Nitrosopumilus piranensis TaxID=1582439 RepID=A0A0C5BYE0_9ARCH|nr:MULTISPECIES: hypothetical protein [Nitrosopumilus]AJM93336.1 conserved exported protein of unknown function [Nitrosopumilus piranensis]KAF6245678.1 hypothetical protein C6989_00610 [Nitrosopumilus sp. b2]
MVKKFYLVLGAIPVIVALLISVPLLTKNEIPISAANSFDKIDIEYTKHQLKKINYGVTERVGAQKTEILTIKNDGEMKYSVTEQGYLQPDIRSTLDEKKLNKIKALIKETGFMQIPSESFPILENATEFQKSNVKITLNGRAQEIHWPEQSATDGFIPPIITMVESELDRIINDISE